MKRFKILNVALLIAVIVTSIIPVGSLTASAATEGDFEYVSLGTNAYLQKYIGNAKSVEIPEKINGKTVTTIDDYAFRNCESVESVTIPSTVTRIDVSAFEGCVNLETINIPSGVTYIGSRVFYGCESLAEITIPASVTYIGTEAFAWCSSLTEINVDSNSKSYASVDGVLFDYGKTRLMNYPAAKNRDTYTVPSTVSGINTNAFSGCAKLQTVILPDTALYIYEYAFAGCTGLTSIYIPTNTVSIAGFAFDGCTALESIDVASNSNSFTSVNGVLFNKAKSRLIRYPSAKADTSYSIPKTVTYIDYGGFADCVNLTAVKIFKGFYYFRDEAFRGCIALKSIALPSSMTSVGSRTFEGCTALESITISSENIYYSSQNGVLFDKQKTYIMYYPQGRASTSYTVPNSVTTIDKRAFYGADNLTKLVIPCSVDEIREDAFLGCDNLTIYAKAQSYAYSYAISNGINAVNNDIVKSVSHSIENGKFVFTIVTYAGDYNKVKLTTSDDLGGSLAATSTYTINENGDYVWTLRTQAPKAATEYTFDFRSSETGYYLKDYYNYTAELISDIKSVSFEKSKGKITFTVTTEAGEYNRIKVTLADDLKGYVKYSDNYTVNADGDYVWTITTTSPTGATEYAFDLRSSETNNYKKEYIYCMVEPAIKSVNYRVSGNKLNFTVTTVAGDFDRLRCGTSASTIGNLKNANKYTVGYGGDYVWQFTLDKPTESITLYFDLRNSNTGKYLQDYYIINYRA